IISQIAAGHRSIKVGDLSPTRDFNFVTDTCRGFIALGETPGIEGREINIATGTEVSMQDTLHTIARLMGAEIEWVTDPQRLRPSKSEVFRLCGDNSLITSLTSWRPEVSLEEGLRHTIDWFTYPSNLAKYKPDVYNV
ncbi:MAG: GDP-mannose 4,6-dehydratase, partial [Muribaculaceae bacterium]|nr:GDP-mannose 4,6-dehydratase [Muribaculaceae bacterium]